MKSASVKRSNILSFLTRAEYGVWWAPLIRFTAKNNYNAFLLWIYITPHGFVLTDGFQDNIPTIKRQCEPEVYMLANMMFLQWIKWIHSKCNAWLSYFYKLSSDPKYLTSFIVMKCTCMSGSRCTSLVCKWCCTTCWWIQLIWDPPIQFSVRPSSRFTKGFLLMAPWFASCWILRPGEMESFNFEATYNS